MNQAEKLLDSLTPATTSANDDTERHIIIGEDRFISVPEELKRIAVQYDHNVETVTFDCPRYWDSHDMSKMIVYINYILPDNTLGAYVADNVRADGDIMHFDWTISRNVTMIKGTIQFLICVRNADIDGNETNHWNSELCKDIYVSEGLETEEQILEDYPDLVSQLLLALQDIKKNTQDVADYRNDLYNKLQVYIRYSANANGSNSSTTWTEGMDYIGIATSYGSPTVMSDYKWSKFVGPTGHSGVYVGSGALPDGCHIRIDPNGDGVEKFDPRDITVLLKRMENLEKSISGQTVTEVESATSELVRTNPENVLPYASVDVVGGMTRKCRNLLPLKDYSRTVNGVAVSISKGVVTVSGTADTSGGRTSALCNIFTLKAGTYTFSCTNEISALSIYLNKSSGNTALVMASKNGASITLEEDTVVFFGLNFEAGATYNASFSVMLNEGDTALPYEPYFEGLRSASVREFVSTGANLIPFPYATGNAGDVITRDGIEWTVNKDGSITANGTAKISTSFTLARGMNFGNNAGYGSSHDNAVSMDGFVAKNCDYNPNNGNVYIYIEQGVIINKTFYPMISRSVLPYEPYRRTVFTMPFRAGFPDTYGMKIGDVHDSIDWANMRYIKRIGKVIYNGTERWYLDRYNSHGAYVYSTTLTSTTLATSDTFTRSEGSWGEKGVGYFSPNGTNIFFNSDKATVEEWKAYLAEKPVTVFYELATPEILALPSELNALEGYGWGVSDTVYNYVDWEKKQFVKKVGKVDLGTLYWHLDSGRFYAYVSDMAPPSILDSRTKGFICDKYSNSTTGQIAEMENKSAVRRGGTTFMIRDDDYTDAATFKAAMSGVMLYYELAEPVITDISELLSPDNLIEVSEGGTVEVVTDYEYMDSVPTKLTYQCKNTIVT